MADPCPAHRWRYTPGCEDCRKHQRARVRKNRAERLITGRLNHGKRSAYDAGCECRDCLRARAEAYARLERR